MSHAQRIPQQSWQTFKDGTPCLSEEQIQKIIEKAQKHPGLLRNDAEIQFIDSIANLPVNWRLSKAQDKWLRTIALDRLHMCI